MTRVANVAGAVLVAAVILIAVVTALAPASGGPAVQLVTRAGFGPPDERRDGRTRWLEGDAGRLQLTVRDHPRRVAVGIELSSFHQPRHAVVTMGGRTAAEGAVPAGTFTTLRADLGELPAGRHDLTVRVAPGPQSIAQAVGVPDPRVVSVRVRALTARERGAPR